MKSSTSNWSCHRLRQGPPQRPRVFGQRPAINRHRLDVGSPATEFFVKLSVGPAVFLDGDPFPCDGSGVLESRHEFPPRVGLGGADGDRHVPFAQHDHRLRSAHGDRHLAQRVQKCCALKTRLNDFKQDPCTDACEKDHYVEFCRQQRFGKSETPRDSNRLALRASTERPSQCLPVVRSRSAFRRIDDFRSCKRAGRSRARTNRQGGVRRKITALVRCILSPGGYKYEYTDPANGRDTPYNKIRGLRRPTGKSEALSRVHAEACSGSTPGRPSQCRRAKVWATKKNPGIVVGIWQKACHGSCRARNASFLAGFAATSANRRFESRRILP